MKRKKTNKLRITQDKEYDITQSPFYKLYSIDKLILLLKTKKEILGDILAFPNNYYKFKNNNGRDIQTPNKEMALYPIHNRIANHLRAVITPDYLFSDKKNCTVYGNASVHLGCDVLLNVDISKFFPSTTYNKVFKFFRYKLCCSVEISEILTYICTVNGHIPTGSQISMRLAFLVNQELFDELYNLASSKNIKMSLWVDDISFSGSNVNSKFKYLVYKIIREYGFEVSEHKTKLSYKGQSKSVTGVFIDSDKVTGASEHYKKRRVLLEKWKKASKQHIFNKKQFKQLENIKIEILGLLHYLNHFEQSSKNYISLIESDFERIKRNYIYNKNAS